MLAWNEDTVVPGNRATLRIHQQRPHCNLWDLSNALFAFASFSAD